MIASSLEKLKESHTVEVEWHSFELRPVDGPPSPPEYIAKVKAARPQFYQMAKEKYGLDLKPGPFGINSRPSLIGAKYAAEKNMADPYHDAIFRVYWMEGQDISDEAVLEDVAVSIGLDGGEFIDALTNEPYRGEMMRDVELAHDYGLSGVPALIFANKYLAVGAQPYETLTNIVEKIQVEG
ncbi:MAG: DsbA family protein [Chloroflexota bacterium]